MSRTVSVLVVESHQHMRTIYRSLLRPLLNADRIYEARDGVQALELLRAYPIDLALFELHLPDLNGLELIHLIRRAPDSLARELPILVVSADATARTVRSVRDAGGGGFLAKPFTPKALQAALQRLAADERPFVRCAAYCGPDRRRERPQRYFGPFRRATDAELQAVASAPSP